MESTLLIASPLTNQQRSKSMCHSLYLHEHAPIWHSHLQNSAPFQVTRLRPLAAKHHGTRTSPNGNAASMGTYPRRTSLLAVGHLSTPLEPAVNLRTSPAPGAPTWLVFETWRHANRFWETTARMAVEMRQLVSGHRVTRVLSLRNLVWGLR